MRKTLLALSVLVAGLAVAACDVVAETVVTAYRFAESKLKALVAPAILASAEADQPASPPVVALRRAGQFVLRLLKRERPEVTPEWRMCPSI